MPTITPGRHQATVVSAQIGESTEKRTPGVFIDFRLENSADIRGTLWLSDRAYERSLNTLREVFAFNDDFLTIHDQLEGRPCSVVIEFEPDQKDPAKSWPRVKWINPAGGGAREIAPVETSLLGRLTQQARGFARPADAPKPQPKVAPKPAQIESDEVPF